MLRLCSDSSRSYPGRSVRIAVPDTWGCALHGNMPGYRSEVSRSHSRRGRRPHAIGRLETSPVSREALPRRRAERRTGEEPQ